MRLSTKHLEMFYQTMNTHLLFYAGGGSSEDRSLGKISQQVNGERAETPKETLAFQSAQINHGSTSFSGRVGGGVCRSESLGDGRGVLRNGNK